MMVWWYNVDQGVDSLKMANVLHNIRQVISQFNVDILYWQAIAQIWPQLISQLVYGLNPQASTYHNGKPLPEYLWWPVASRGYDLTLKHADPVANYKYICTQQ